VVPGREAEPEMGLELVPEMGLEAEATAGAGGSSFKISSQFSSSIFEQWNSTL